MYDKSSVVSCGVKRDAGIVSAIRLFVAVSVCSDGMFQLLNSVRSLLPSTFSVVRAVRLRRSGKLVRRFPPVRSMLVKDEEPTDAVASKLAILLLLRRRVIKLWDCRFDGWIETTPGQFVIEK